jgi:hypothetical protein
VHERSECVGGALLRQKRASEGAVGEETPRTPSAAGDVSQGCQIAVELLFCGRSGQNLALSGGDPPTPPRGRRRLAGSPDCG